MRWENLRANGTSGPGPPELPLGLDGARVRTFHTPGFKGITCYEIAAKSIINKVPPAARVPFQWTINPYRGCSHACRYCFARNTHTYLDLDAGHDFDTRIVVKVNAAKLLRRELTAPRWHGEHIAMGTNVDCYQRVEGRYRLMPPIIEALRDHANPFSILTKGTLILRDLDLLCQAAAVTTVGLAVSIGFVDERLWRWVEWYRRARTSGRSPHGYGPQPADTAWSGPGRENPEISLPTARPARRPTPTPS